MFIVRGPFWCVCVCVECFRTACVNQQCVPKPRSHSQFCRGWLQQIWCLVQHSGCGCGSVLIATSNLHLLYCRETLSESQCLRVVLFVDSACATSPVTQAESGTAARKLGLMSCSQRSWPDPPCTAAAPAQLLLHVLAVPATNAALQAHTCPVTS